MMILKPELTKDEWHVKFVKEIEQLKAENARLSGYVVAMANEIEAMCPPRKIVKRWVLDAKRDALADTQESEDLGLVGASDRPWEDVLDI